MYSSLKKYAGACFVCAIAHLVSAILVFMYLIAMDLGVFIVALTAYLFVGSILFVILAKALWDLQDELHTHREVDFEDAAALRKRVEELESIVKQSSHK